MQHGMVITQVLAFALLAATQVHADTILFPEDTPYLQVAIDSVAPGDTVLIEPGHWIVGTVYLRSGISIRSQNGNPGTTGLRGRLHANDVNGVVLGGLMFGDEGVSCVSSEVVMLDVILSDNPGKGLSCESSAVTLRHVHVIGNECGIFCEDSELLLEDVVFRYNGRVSCGAGMYCSSSNVTMADCLFESNEVGSLDHTNTWWQYGGEGGGACLENGSTLTARDVVFDSNHTWYAGGGLALLGEGTRAELTECVFINNTTSTHIGSDGARQRGADLFIDDAEVTLDGVRFTRSWCNHDGGAVYCTGQAHVVVTDCVFTECEADRCGGAITAKGTADISVRDSFFRGNAAGNRGGAVSAGGAQTEFSHCIFVDNSANSSGGAISAGPVPVGISNCTMTGNLSFSGSALYFDGTSGVLSNCILNSSTGNSLVSCSIWADVDIVRCCAFKPIGSETLCWQMDQNVFAEPLFCTARARDFSLCSDSPCLPSNNEWGELVGAVGEGCGPCNTPVLDTSWGSIKAMFRGE